VSVVGVSQNIYGIPLNAVKFTGFVVSALVALRQSCAL